MISRAIWYDKKNAGGRLRYTVYQFLFITIIWVTS